MSHLIEVDPTQLVLLTDLLDAADRAGQIPAGKAMPWAAIRQQLAQPQETSAVIARIKAEAVREMNTPTPPAQ